VASGTVVPRASIFDLGTPAVADSGDGFSVVLGVKFKADVSGSITGLRFYKAAANTGTHVGSLWSSSGTLLAQATFTNESASGWQTVQFAAPVAITAGTTYVAAYLAPNGHYSASLSAFDTGVDNGALHALATSTTPNGVYAYSGSSVYPANDGNSVNYWVDVLFAPGGGT
jgi:hypothetical protein